MITKKDKKDVNERVSSTLKVDVFNVFATMRIGSIDLQRLAAKINGSVYEPETSPSLDVKIEKCLFRMHSSGSIIIFGANEERVKSSSDRLLKTLRELGVTFDLKPKLFTHNVATMCKIGKRIRLWKASYILGDTTYNPEKYSSLVYKMKEPSVTFQLFPDGTIVCLGVRDKRKAIEAISALIRELEDLGLLERMP